MDNPAWELVQDEFTSDEFDLYQHYPEEMAVSEVASLAAHYKGLNTYLVHEAGHDQSGSDQFVYGDTPVPVMYRLLRRWGVTGEDRFLDMGCGCGMPTLTASLVAGEARGIDIVPTVVDFCRRSRDALGIGNADFRLQDMLEADLGWPTFVYLAWTTFPPPLRKKIAAKLRECKKGTKIVTVTVPLDGKEFLPVVKVSALFSWSGLGEGYPFEFHMHVRK